MQIRSKCPQCDRRVTFSYPLRSGSFVCPHCARQSAVGYKSGGMSLLEAKARDGGSKAPSSGGFMKRLRIAVLLAVSSALLPGAPVSAQSPAAAARLSHSRGEVLAVELKQGMTPDEVQKLLGKPRRTALKTGFGALSESTLRWTYSWGSDGLSEKNLQVVFASKAPERWQVTSWDWGSY